MGVRWGLGSYSQCVENAGLIEVASRVEVVPAFWGGVAICSAFLPGARGLLLARVSEPVFWVSEATNWFLIVLRTGF